MFYDIFQVLSTTRRVQEGGTDEKRVQTQRETPHLVHSRHTFFFRRVFIILTNYLCYFHVLSTTRRVREGCDDDSGP